MPCVFTSVCVRNTKTTSTVKRLQSDNKLKDEKKTDVSILAHVSADPAR